MSLVKLAVALALSEEAWLIGGAAEGCDLSLTRIPLVETKSLAVNFE